MNLPLFAMAACWIALVAGGQPACAADAAKPPPVTVEVASAHTARVAPRVVTARLPAAS